MSSNKRSHAAIVAVVLVSMAIAAPSSALGPAAWPDCIPHPPIRISGNADLAAAVLPTGQPAYRPGSGVFSGHGTPESPFVIEDLCIVGDHASDPALVISGTSAHLVIRDVDVSSASTRGFKIADAANVTIERIGGLRDSSVDRSHDISVRGSTMWGLDIYESSRIEVQGTLFNGPYSQLQAIYVVDLIVANNTFLGGTYAADFREVERLHLRGNTFEGSENAIVLRQVWDSRVALNRIIDVDDPLRVISGGGNELDNNDILGGTSPILISGTGQILRNNSVIGPGIRLLGTENVLAGNVMEGPGLIFGSKDLASRLHQISADNTENGIPIRYFRQLSGGIVDGGVGRIFLVASTGVTVTRQTYAVEVAHSSSTTVAASSGPITLLWTTSSTVRDNAFTDVGLVIEAASSNRIERNSFTGGLVCIDLYGSPNNEFRDNRFERCGWGLTLENGRNNIVEHNLVANSTVIGIESYSTGFGNDGTILRHNIVTGNRLGIRIHVTPITVSSNNIFGNGLGLQADGTSVSATSNWWGCAGGPGVPGCDAIAGPVQFKPVSAASLPGAGPR